MNEVIYDPFNSNDSIYDNCGKPIYLNAGDKNIVKLELKLPNGKRKFITNEWLKNIINTKCIYTANNTLFLKHEVKQGIVSKWSEVFYNLRKSTKKKELKIFHDLHDKTLNFSKNEKEKMNEDMENYHTAQIGLKNSINSVYGCLGTGFSPIANPDIAQSITRMGRFCNINASKFIIKRFKELYNCGDGYEISLDDDNKNKIRCLSIGGDTDSVLGNTLINIKFLN